MKKWTDGRKWVLELLIREKLISVIVLINLNVKGSLCLTKDERAPIDGRRCAAFTFLVLSFTEDSVKPSWGSSLANVG